MSPSLTPHPSFIAASLQNTISLHAFSQCLPNLRFFGNANLKGEISLPMLRIITLFGPQISPFQAHRILKGRLVGHKPISLKTLRAKQTNQNYHPIILSSHPSHKTCSKNLSELSCWAEYSCCHGFSSQTPGKRQKNRMSMAVKRPQPPGMIQ